jgi:hypothetical protein
MIVEMAARYFQLIDRPIFEVVSMPHGFVARERVVIKREATVTEQALAEQHGIFRVCDLMNAREEKDGKSQDEDQRARDGRRA